MIDILTIMTVKFAVKCQSHTNLNRIVIGVIKIK